MPGKSKKSSKKKAAKAEPTNRDGLPLDRPFAPKVWKQAEALAAKYQFVVKYEPEEPYFYAFGVEARGAMGGGETIEACHEDIRRSMALWVASMLEHGESPPQPASDEKRTSQVNVRLTESEKFRIEEAARQAGFRGVSDFVRTAALDRAG